MSNEQTRHYLAGSLNYLKGLIENDDEKKFPLYDSFIDRRSHQEHFDRLNFLEEDIKASFTVVKASIAKIQDRLNALEEALDIEKKRRGFLEQVVADMRAAAKKGAKK